MAETDEQSAKTEIALPQTLCLKSTQGLIDALAAAPRDGVIEIESGEVGQMNTPAALAILSAVSSRADDAPKIVIKNAPTAFVDAFSDLGFFQDIMKMEFRQ